MTLHSTTMFRPTSTSKNIDEAECSFVYYCHLNFLAVSQQYTLAKWYNSPYDVFFLTVHNVLSLGTIFWLVFLLQINKIMSGYGFLVLKTELVFSSAITHIAI